jgi:hypothetical protein
MDLGPGNYIQDIFTYYLEALSTKYRVLLDSGC